MSAATLATALIDAGVLVPTEDNWQVAAEAAQEWIAARLRDPEVINAACRAFYNAAGVHWDTLARADQIGAHHCHRAAITEVSRILTEVAL